MCIDNEKCKVISVLATDPNTAVRCHELAGRPTNEHKIKTNSYRTIFMPTATEFFIVNHFSVSLGKLRFTPLAQEIISVQG